MAVENGTYAKPMATIGSKPDQAWTNTTTAAGVDSKPQPGRPITVVGEIVDFSCYIQLGKHGEKHRSCGQKCVQNGQPIGVLTQTGTLYMLMPEEHDPRRDGGVEARQSAPGTLATFSKLGARGRRAADTAGFTLQGSTKKSND